MIPFLELFWHSSHRVGRIGFVAVSVVLIALLAAIETLGRLGLAGWAGFILTLAVGYSALCILSLRLHDRGRSGWLGWLVLMVFAMAWPLTQGASPDIMNVSGAILLTAIFIDLALMPGQKTLNRHGPCPSARPLCQSSCHLHVDRTV